MALETGNVIFTGDDYKLQGIRAPNGRVFIRQVGIARLTDALQTTIPLEVIAWGQPRILHGQTYPPKPLKVPVGGQIERVDFRLPLQSLPGDEAFYGIYLPKSCTLVGTTGENLKVSPTTGTTHTVTSPAIACANNAYAAGAGAVAARQSGLADQASPNLIRTVSGSELTFQITVSNAGNTAAGTGIRLSQTGAKSLIYAQIIYSLDGEAIMQSNENFYGSASYLG